MFTKINFIAALLCASLISAFAFAEQTETPYTTYSRYNERGILLGTISAGTASGYLATRNNYDDSGKLTYVEKGNLKKWLSDATFPDDWTNFTITSVQKFGYDAYGRKTTEATYDNAGNPLSLVQMNYDSEGHVLCKAVRMNPAVYNSLPDACVLSATGANGADRISKFTYNGRDQIVTETRALGIPGKEQVYVTNTYTSTYLKTQVDANNNKTTLYYDANARLEHIEYPVTTKGALASNPSDYVQFTYDNNGNKLTERKRNGETIAYTYDANDRMTLKDYANNATIKDVCYVYDNRGLQTESHFGNSDDPATCISGVGLSNTYDGVGNILTSTTNQSGAARTLIYTYDLNNNRRTITHPDKVLFKYGFDGINRVTGVANFGQAYDTLLAVHYGISGKRSSITRNGSLGAVTEFKFDNGVQLNQFTQNLGSTTDSLTNTFAYNAASQVIQLTESNSSYSYVGNDDRAGDYTPDGLNRYVKAPLHGMGVVPFDYDNNQNLKNDGSSIYTYDTENHLLSATVGTKLTAFEYDPNGRLFQYTTSDGTKHQYLYDNNALVLEYINGAIDKRYVHGDQVDEPWIMYNGASVDSASLSYLHANHQGSIIAYTNASGQVTNKLAYDAYGIPASMNMGTFGYTGQVYLKELGLYYYKARIYHPQLGRFMQTDPIGYKDDMDLYAYVGNDPVNKTDPTGLCPQCVGFVIGVGLEVARQAVTGELQNGSALANIGKASAAGLAGAAGIGIGRGIAALSSSIAVRALVNGAAGAAVGAANQVVNNAVDQKNLGDGAGRAAAFGALGAAAGSAIGDKVDAAINAGRDALQMGTGNIAANNLAQGIEQTTAKSNITSAFAPAGATIGEKTGAAAGGIPPAADSVSQCKKDKSC